MYFILHTFFGLFSVVLISNLIWIECYEYATDFTYTGECIFVRSGVCARAAKNHFSKQNTKHKKCKVHFFILISSFNFFNFFSFWSFHCYRVVVFVVAAQVCVCVHVFFLSYFFWHFFCHI